VYVATGVLITLYILFYFLRDGSEMLRGLRRYLPLARHETDRLFRTTAETIRAVVFGTMAVSLIQGVLGGLIFWWLDLPAPLVWGAVMAFLSLLPMFGAALVWAPVALFLALQGDWQSALILAAWGAIVIGLSDNLLRPLLVKGQSQMHTLTVFIAMLGGLSAFGATGLVLGPLVVAIGTTLLDIWRARTAAGDTVEEGVDER
jgi:predicted PurR-regulated permease PerM